MSFLLSDEDRKKIIAALNVDLGLEMGAIIQYMYHHFVAEGMESPAIVDLFEDIAKVEMKHMQKFGDRINYLGGEPTVKPAPVKTGGDLKKMIHDNLDGENFAIKTYREHINLCAKIGDTTTRLMLEEIVSDEEDHANTWETTLSVKK